jgi:long-subunit acyl-CoA synthetase (AMP-forming)
MSECSPKITIPDYEHPEKVESVGRPVTGAKIRIVNGEIQVSSPSVMLGYYNDEELTHEALTDDGYLRTGDTGYLDDDGFLS